MKEMFGEFVAGVMTTLFALLLLTFGFMAGRGSVVSECRNYGAAKVAATAIACELKP